MYEFSDLKKFSELVCAHSDKSDGNMSFKWGSEEEVSRNREVFFNKLGVKSEKIAAMDLKHGTDIARVSRSPGDKEMIEADCLMTKSQNVFLFVLTGDCLPVIFYDPIMKILALAHLSRINTPEGFLEKIIKKFLEEGSKAEDIVVAIGPGVGKGSYIFDKEELAERKLGKEWDDFIVEIAGGRFGVDLAGYSVHQLVSAGVLPEHIVVSDIDTIADRNFFSHYRSMKTGEKEGRMAIVVSLVK